MIRRRARLLGWATALGQVGFGVAQRLLWPNTERIEAIWRLHGLDPSPPRHVTVHRVPSVNSDECRRLLAALAPAVVAVYGTRILKRETLLAVPAPFINYHAGINPKYRGQHPGYWALAQGDELLHEVEDFAIFGQQGPVKPAEFIVLAVGVVVAVLGAADFIAHEQHGDAQREQVEGEEVFDLADA